MKGAKMKAFNIAVTAVGIIVLVELVGTTIMDMMAVPWEIGSMIMLCVAAVMAICAAVIGDIPSEGEL